MNGILARLGAACSGLGGTAARFPLPLACALVAAVAMIVTEPLFDTEGYRLFGFVNKDTRRSGRWWSFKGRKAGELYRLSLDPETGRPRVDGPGAMPDISIDLNPIAAKVRRLKDADRGKHMTIDAVGRTLKIRLMPMNLCGRIVAGQPKVHGIETILLIGDNTG